MKNGVLALVACVIMGFGMGLTLVTCMDMQVAGKVDLSYLQTAKHMTLIVCVAAACGVPYLFTRRFQIELLIGSLVLTLGSYGVTVLVS